MTRPSDNDLVDRLHDELAERRSTISARDDLGDRARRSARRRTARLTVTAGVPVLAAAGVATVLLTGAGSGGPSAKDGHRPAASVATTGAVQTHNTAYIVRRLRASLVDDAPGKSHVLHTLGYTSGHAASNGALVDVGRQSSDSWAYYTPNGAWYGYNTGQSDPGVTGISEVDPVVNGRGRTTLTVLNARNKTYSVTVTIQKVPRNAPMPTDPADITFGSAGTEVEQALRDGEVRRLGTVDVNGIQAVALKVKTPKRDQLDYTMYVDTRNYQVVRTVSFGTAPGQSETFVTDMVPATSTNIAKAKDHSVPPGYTKVDHTAG